MEEARMSCLTHGGVMDNHRRYKHGGIEEIDELIPFVTQGRSLKKAERKAAEDEVQNGKEIIVLLHDISNAMVTIVLAVRGLKQSNLKEDVRIDELIQIIETSAERAVADLKVLRTLCAA
jgi:hypothetical protein